MSRKRGRAPAVALASVAGGAVTSERLEQAARREGRGGSPLIRSLLAQALPSDDDLARVYGGGAGAVRLDSSFLVPAPGATRLLDPELLRRHCCVPVVILDHLCVLAVSEPTAREAVLAVRMALRRDVLPVRADARALQDVLGRLAATPRAVRQGAIRPKGSPAQSRFSNLILSGETLDALALPPVSAEEAQ